MAVEDLKPVRRPVIPQPPANLDPELQRWAHELVREVQQAFDANINFQDYEFDHVTTNDFYVQLPTGTVISFGEETVTASSGSETFPITYEAAPVVLATVNSSSGTQSVRVDNVTTTGFDWSTSASVDKINWAALGYIDLNVRL